MKSIHVHATAKRLELLENGEIVKTIEFSSPIIRLIGQIGNNEYFDKKDFWGCGVLTKDGQYYLISGNGEAHPVEIGEKIIHATGSHPVGWPCGGGSGLVTENGNYYTVTCEGKIEKTWKADRFDSPIVRAISIDPCSPTTGGSVLVSASGAHYYVGRKDRKAPIEIDLAGAQVYKLLPLTPREWAIESTDESSWFILDAREGVKISKIAKPTNLQLACARAAASETQATPAEGYNIYPMQ